MKIAIIDYNAGNVQSVLFALQRLGMNAELTSDHAHIRAADKVIFPGVGEAQSTMAYLKGTGLAQLIPSLTQPVLGICLGMQLLCEHSEEGDTFCLGIIPQKVVKFVPKENFQKVPHMGWNTIQNISGGLFDASHEAAYVYFVHSYFVKQGVYTTAICNYIQPFSAAVQKENFYATQFHPEKSGGVGERILQNFLNLPH